MKKDERVSNPSKMRVDLRLYSELVSVSVFSLKLGLPLLGNVLTTLVAQAIITIMSFNGKVDYNSLSSGQRVPGKHLHLDLLLQALRGRLRRSHPVSYKQGGQHARSQASCPHLAHPPKASGGEKYPHRVSWKVTFAKPLNNPSTVQAGDNTFEHSQRAEHG